MTWTEKQTPALFQYFAGLERLDVFNSFSLANNQQKAYTAVDQMFQEYFAPTANETFERQMFRNTRKMEVQSLKHLLKELEVKVHSLKFGVLTGSMMWDQIVDGVHADKPHGYLLRENDLSSKK